MNEIHAEMCHQPIKAADMFMRRPLHMSRCCPIKYENAHDMESNTNDTRKLQACLSNALPIPPLEKEYNSYAQFNQIL